METERNQEERYDREDMARAVEILKQGGIILYPTDTVWGIGCDATNTEAVKKIYDLKKRSDAKSMLVLVGSEGELQRTVEEVPEAAWMLIEAAVNPLTIIYDRPRGLAVNLLFNSVFPPQETHSLHIGQRVGEKDTCGFQRYRR